MPTEDIQYLLKYGQKEDRIIFIDSSNRDKNSFAHPNEYVWTFDEPFKNVVGIDILDAAVPRTMYNVDKYTRTLVFGIGVDPLAFHGIDIDDRDYNFETLLAQMADQLTAMEFDGVSYDLSVAKMVDGKSRFTMTALYPFVFDMEATTMSETLGFDELPEDGSPDYVWVRHPTRRKLFGCRSESQSTNDIQFGARYTSPASPNFTTNFHVINKHKYVAQNINLNALQFLHQLRVQLYQQNPASPPNLNDFVIKFKICKATQDNTPDLSQVLREGEFTTKNQTNWQVTTPTFSGDDFALTTFVDGVDYWLIIWEDTQEDDATSLGVTYNVSAKTNPAMFSTDDGTTWQSVPLDKLYCVTVTSIMKTFYMNSPGLVSLIGERFVILRCPEIESHVYGSGGYGINSPGLGLFKMGVVGYSDSRFDFSSIRYKEFHPIGKLSRLTFRFETLRKNLYDFRGVNHHIMLVVRYYVMNTHPDFLKFTLNPHYNPNFMNYMRTIEDRETSSVEEEDEDERHENFREHYLREERRYDIPERKEFAYMAGDESAGEEEGGQDPETSESELSDYL